MHILGPESVAMRRGLVKHLAGIECAEATRALAQLAVFSPEEEVRRDALAGLKSKPAKDYSDFLVSGLRYPWPAVAKHAADAMVKIERKDLVSQLVDFLDEPDPRRPVVKEVNGRKAPVVRELVRLNHHHNCLLCHAPAKSSGAGLLNRDGRIAEFVTGTVPHPGTFLPPPSQYYRDSSPDILVRADVTYLRQDFSLMQPVKNAEPWPTMQRFDFLVRNREISALDAEIYQEWLAEQGPGYLSPHHQAALAALRSLTGRDAPPNSQAWRRALGN